MASERLVRVGYNQRPVAQLADNRANDRVIEADHIVDWAKAVDHHTVFDVVVHQFQLPGFGKARLWQDLTPFQCSLELGENLRNAGIAN